MDQNGEKNQGSSQDRLEIPRDFQALVAGFFPSTKYFDSRFDLLQVQVDELRRNQHQFQEQLKDFKEDTDKRFEQVEQRFQRLEDKIDTLIERIDVKVDSGLKENRTFTLRLFTFAISFSLLAVIGMFGKLFGVY